jgi:hypothetical protein
VPEVSFFASLDLSRLPTPGYGHPALDALPDEMVAVLRRRRPDADPADFVAVGWQACRDRIERYVAAGITKFVIRPVGRAAETEHFMEGFIRELMPLEN